MGGHGFGAFTGSCRYAIPGRRFLRTDAAASLEQRICLGMEMSALFFAVPDGVEMPRLCSCTPQAQLVVSVMPITASERAFAVQHGSERLVELFERHPCSQLFDMSRKAVA